jgi:hypothetical protein
MRRAGILMVVVVLSLTAVAREARADGELYGWGYMSWPYVYSYDAQTWCYFDPASSTNQWVYDYGQAQWARLANSQLSGGGWVFFALPYVYSLANDAWSYYFNVPNNFWLYDYDILRWVQKTAAALPVKQFAGNYGGTFTGDDTGTWSGTVRPSGGVAGSVWSNFYHANFNANGVVYSSGGLAVGVAASNGVSMAAWNGTISATTGQVSGTWSDQWGNSGTFTGQRY